MRFRKIEITWSIILTFPSVVKSFLKKYSVFCKIFPLQMNKTAKTVNEYSFLHIFMYIHSLSLVILPKMYLCISFFV